MSVGINKIPPRVSNDSSLGRPKENAIYVGIVKKNDDPQRMGRLWVYIPELGGDPTDPDFWVICAYASPFAGASDPSGLQANSPDAEGSQTSYGMWMVPPDLENRVLVCFAAGNTANAYWFACLFPQNMNHMVPSIAMGKTTSSDVCVAPVTEYNKKSEEDPDEPNRPIFSSLTMGLLEQGLGLDDERGGTSTSARREAPSKAFGILTPRGNSFAVDDDPENEFVRIRTRSGAQVLVHETTGYVYINSKLGNSWVEISDDGIDMYTKGSFSVRAEQNLNFRADKDIILDAGANVHMRAAGGDVTAQSAGNIVQKAGGNHNVEAGSKSTTRAGGSIVRSGSNIYDNTTSPAAVEVPKTQTLTDPQPDGMTNVDTITTRMPTHEPWPHHPKRQFPPKAGIEYQDASSAGAAGGGQSGVDNGNFSSSPITDGEYRQKAPTVMSRLMQDLNITEEQAAGIVGNLGHESAGLQPDINEIGSGAGYGWAQWTGSRRNDFFNYASANNLNPASDEANYRFLVHELRTSEVGSLQALRRASSVTDATRIFEQKFERAGVVNLSSRLNYANSAYNAYKGGSR